VKCATKLTQQSYREFKGGNFFETQCSGRCVVSMNEQLFYADNGLFLQRKFDDSPIPTQCWKQDRSVIRTKMKTAVCRIRT